MNILTCSAYFNLYTINHIKKMLTANLATLIHALVTSCVDYCNCLLSVLQHKSVHKLQLVQNSVTRTPTTEHITPILKQLHWSPAIHYIQVKILLVTFMAVHNFTTLYCCEKLQSYTHRLSDLLLSSSAVYLPIYAAPLQLNAALFSKYLIFHIPHSNSSV